MPRFLFFCLCFVALRPMCGYSQSLIACEVNLKSLPADRAEVSYRLPTPPSDTLRFYLPRIVPGIYGAMNFGQYVHDFQALDTSGAPLPVTKTDVNAWEIHGARQLKRLQYTVDDTWDAFEKNFVRDFYKSAGSMWRRDSVAIVNHNCVVGYFDCWKTLPYQVEYRRPAGFFGATALSRTGGTDTTDVYRSDSYRTLVDAPVLYARPDTAVLRVGNAEVLVAVHAGPSGHYAASLAEGIRALLESQKDYLGGRLPVNRYAFLIYQVNSPRRGDSAGDALEHTQSTLCLFMTEALGAVGGMVSDIASHEFFHIVTPLNIHSERIADYDFNAPKQSKHLWLYEGMTEYATLHMPVKQGLIGVPEFLERVSDKIRKSAPYDPTLSLTAASENAIARQDQYYNFYLKGALVGLCLDVRLREWSDGHYGVQDLMRNLSLKFGPGRPFGEDELFDQIAALTDPALRDFFRRHVEGVEPLPLETVFAKVGLRLEGAELKPNPNATNQQLQLRKAWLGQ